MISIKRALKYLFTNPSQFCDSFVKNCLFFLPDKAYLSLRYRCIIGKWIDWKHPVTFTEKLQWLKLYNRKDIYTTMVDKYAVKAYVGEIIGVKYIIPTLHVWNSVSDINWDQLPDQFVLKTTHGAGSCAVIICKDKSQLNTDSAIRILNTSLKADGYRGFREWPYKNVPRRIIAEKYMSTQDNDLIDYKFFCFNGEPKYCQVIRDRTTAETIDFYDMQWKHQEFVGLMGLTQRVNNGETDLMPPVCLDEMIGICRALSKDTNFLRVDLYEVNGQVYFGELTFYPASGLGHFSPSEWDRVLGDYIVLDKDR